MIVKMISKNGKKHEVDVYPSNGCVNLDFVKSATNDFHRVHGVREEIRLIVVLNKYN